MINQKVATGNKDLTFSELSAPQAVFTNQERNFSLTGERARKITDLLEQVAKASVLNDEEQLRVATDELRVFDPSSRYVEIAHRIATGNPCSDGRVYLKYAEIRFGNTQGPRSWLSRSIA